MSCATAMRGTPLPALFTAQADYPHMKTGNANLLSAYALVLDAERRASDKLQGDQSTSNNLICARIIGWLLLHPVDDNPPPFLPEIPSTNTSDDSIDKIYTLGGQYLHYIIPLCMYLPCLGHMSPSHLKFAAVKHRKRENRIPSETPSRSTFDVLRDKILTSSKTSPRDHETAKAQVCLCFSIVLPWLLPPPMRLPRLPIPLHPHLGPCQ